tara:strand:- start:1602 stop:2534 length:933 start_codon:yes stop_codon:yes gene_type:complete
MDDISTQSYIGNIMLENCLMNASGCNCQFLSDLIQLDKSNSGAVVSKSCSVNNRLGNPIPRYYHNDTLSINSMGLPNEGYKYYIEAGDSIHKPYIMSISSQALYEDISILEKASSSNISAIELNVSCPNIAGDPQLSYSFDRLEEFLRKVFEYADYNKHIGIKLSPYFDISHFNMAFDILNMFKTNITFLTCINGIGNGLYIDLDKEEPIIKPKNGLGGLGGSIVKPTGLANVNLFANNTNFDIVGCGGITSGQDAFEYILCGAKTVQVGTQLVKEGTDVFSRIDTELKKIMYDKNYNSIECFRNKLTYK